MNEQEQKQINKIIDDIKDLRSKLLNEATRKIENPVIAKGEDGKKRDVSERERRQKVRQMKNRLRELIDTYRIIREAEEIEKIR